MIKELELCKNKLHKKEYELKKSIEVMDEMNNKLTDLANDNARMYQKLNENYAKNDLDIKPNVLVKQINN